MAERVQRMVDQIWMVAGAMKEREGELKRLKGRQQPGGAWPNISKSVSSQIAKLKASVGNQPWSLCVI